MNLLELIDFVNSLPSVGGLDINNDLFIVVTGGTDFEVATAADILGNLSTIQALTPSDDDFLQRKSGAWANRTIAQVKADLFTGVIDAGGATSLEIPNSATPTVDATGEIAIDTTVTDFSHGVMKYFGGEELAVIAVPIAELTGLTDGHVVRYNATNDEFEIASPTAGTADIEVGVTNSDGDPDRLLKTDSSGKVHNAAGITSSADGSLTLIQTTLTGSSTPAISHTGTWNNGATTFVNLFSNITDTSSAFGSLLLDLQVGGASKMSLRKDGMLTIANNLVATGSAIFAVGYYDYATNNHLTFPETEVWRLNNAADSKNVALLTGVSVNPKTSSPYSVSAVEARRLFTNEGASARQDFQLPAAVAGISYSFFIQDSDGIRIIAGSGDTIRVGASVSSAAGRIDSSTIGDSVTLTAINATEWVATAFVGTWVAT